MRHFTEEGHLYLVPTPVGNLQDITLRSIGVLKEANLILCEDTRTTSVLLKHFDISTRTQSFHQHNEHAMLKGILQRLRAGECVAQVSDAGTPGISDPGFLLARACAEAGIPFTCLPGATAFVPALVLSGFPTDRFVFEGFLPHKKGRLSRIQEIAEEEKTVVLYESPHRLVKCLEQLAEQCGPERQAAVVREISKKFEECRRGSLHELIGYFGSHEPKGEIVLVLSGKPEVPKVKNKYRLEEED